MSSSWDHAPRHASDAPTEVHTRPQQRLKAGTATTYEPAAQGYPDTTHTIQGPLYREPKPVPPSRRQTPYERTQLAAQVLLSILCVVAAELALIVGHFAWHVWGGH